MKTKEEILTEKENEARLYGCNIKKSRLNAMDEHAKQLAEEVIDKLYHKKKAVIMTYEVINIIKQTFDLK